MGPVKPPDQFPRDLTFTPDGKHLLMTFQSGTMSELNVATQQWSSVPAWQSISMAKDGHFATSPAPPENWDGFQPLGTVLMDISGHISQKLTQTGSEPIVSPDAKYVLWTDEALVHIGSRGMITFRVAPSGGKTMYTISKPGWELGRDTNRGGISTDNMIEGPQWSADGRYVVFGVYNPYD